MPPSATSVALTELLLTISATAATQTPSKSKTNSDHVEANPLPQNGKPLAGALLTIFTAPTGCGSVMTGDPMSQDLGCAPEGWKTHTKQDGGWRMGFYSPAICPKDYTVACSRPPSLLLGPEVEEGEEAYFCLPRGYACALGSHTLVGLSTDSRALASSAPIIQIRWGETDLTKFETHPLRALEVPTSSKNTARDLMLSTIASPAKDINTITRTTNAAIATNTSLTLKNAPITEHGGSRSYWDNFAPGAKAGIITGSVLAVAVLVVLAAFLTWRRHCRHKLASANSETASNRQDSRDNNAKNDELVEANRANSEAPPSVKELPLQDHSRAPHMVMVELPANEVVERTELPAPSHDQVEQKAVNDGSAGTGAIIRSAA